jgi:hypothetical protein
MYIPGQSVYLDEHSPRAATPPGFIGITLRPHQEAVLASLSAMEGDRALVCLCHDYGHLTVHPVELRSSAVVLAESFGSGKTIELLALCLQRSVPGDVALYSKTEKYEGQYKDYTAHMPRRYIMSTLVFVSSASFAQWEQTIRDHTTLSVLPIKKSTDLSQLAYASSYDVVLVRNGRTGKKHIMSCVSTETERMTWRRVIYDDYDMIKMPHDTLFIDSLFSIFVSATCAVTNRLSKKIASDRYLMSNFRIRCDPKFVQESIAIPVARGYVHVESSSANHLIGLLKDLAVDIAEMLNGDAVCTVASLLGIQSHSITDIFQKVLDTKYVDYTSARLVLQGIESITFGEQDVEDYPSATEWKRIQAIIRKGEPQQVAGRSKKLTELTDELRKQAEEVEAKTGRALRNFVENARAGECQVCLLPLAESGVFVMKCCGVVVCDTCGIESNRISAVRDLRGMCCNCKKPICITDLIFVEQAFGIEKIEMPAPIDMPAAPPTGKAATILGIIKGESMGRPIDLRLPLIQGTKDVPVPAGTPRRFVVFSNYDETLGNIKAELSRAGIDFIVLEGTVDVLRKHLAAFRGGKANVMLINSINHCAGVNLEFVTDIIFTNRIMDKAIEAQAAGRGQRYGRIYSLSIHYVLYENEK